VAVFCLLASAGATTAADPVLRGPIVPGTSIGPLKLGMSEAAARRLLRRFRGSRLELRLRKGKASEYVEYSYPREYAIYTVGYLGRPGARRVAYISVHLDDNKTREGVHVGVLETKLRRSYRGLRCELHADGTPSNWVECILGDRRRRHTVFRIKPEYLGYVRDPARVTRIAVREAFQRFGTSPTDR